MSGDARKTFNTSANCSHFCQANCRKQNNLDVKQKRVDLKKAHFWNVVTHEPNMSKYDPTLCLYIRPSNPRMGI